MWYASRPKRNILFGLVFGVIVAIVIGSISAESASSYYFTIYTPLRVVDWSIIVALIHKGQKPTNFPKIVFWVLGGIIVSFLTDAVSPEGLTGRFCVGAAYAKQPTKILKLIAIG